MRLGQRGRLQSMRLQRFQNRLRRMAFVNEQRQCRHGDLPSFGLAGPVEKGLGQAAKTRDTLRKRRKALFVSLPNLRRGEDLCLSLLRCVRDQCQQPFGEGTIGAFIPRQFGRQAGIVAVGLW